MEILSKRDIYFLAMILYYKEDVFGGREIGKGRVSRVINSHDYLKYLAAKRLKI